MRTNGTIDFERTKVSTLFRRLFFPTLLGMLSVSAVTTIDGIFVGHGVGSDGIAAVNLCIPLLMGLTGVGLMVGAGCSVISSIYLSKGKGSMARASITQALLMVSAVTVALNVVILLFPERTAYLLGASDHLRPMVIDYLLWFMPSLVFELWIAVAMFALRLDGAPRLAMWCSIVAAAVNVVFDWLFIFHWHWGVKGAALATSVSCLIGALMAVGYLVLLAGSMRLHPLRISWRGAVFFFHNIGVQCKIGSSALLGEATMAVLMFTGNHVFMSQWGDAGVGAFGVSCYYLPFVFMTGNAITQSAQPIISFNYGAHNSPRVIRALQVSLATATICGIAVSLGLWAGAPAIVSMFLDTSEEAYGIAVAGLPLFSLCPVFFAINIAFIGYYQSIERAVTSTVFTLLRGMLLLVPCFVALPHLIGVPGLWLAIPAAEAITLIIVVLFYKRHAAAPI